MPLADTVPFIICNRGPAGNPPGWLFRPRPSELAYLGWGRRNYGESPIRPVCHEGWHYFIVIAGEPTLLMGGQRLRGFPGLATICAPGCAVGNTDQPGRTCQILVSIWRTPPRHSALQPTPGGTFTFTLEPAVVRRLKKLHAHCHEAVAAASERSALEVQSARLHLDLALLDARDGADAPEGHFRLDLAIDFLRQHLNATKPVERLCDYLQVSGSSLKRLFLEQTGKSPRAFAAALRMDWARAQLATGHLSVKEISHLLGYRHASDFTRAFKQYFSRTPREIAHRKSA
jgi:AraC-like DNA-binding protein